MDQNQRVNIMQAFPIKRKEKMPSTRRLPETEKAVICGVSKFISEHDITRKLTERFGIPESIDRPKNVSAETYIVVSFVTEAGLSKALSAGHVSSRLGDWTIYPLSEVDLEALGELYEN